ncbi:zinc finger C2H2 type domain containing protein [Nitzschia inconspicua]|uniref:Zinc finger C2H2 type domain containing protein n=1 Tax=Nitzschia inconspicua TaxID=303405 RepID=A0A9K3LP19_9STRA|nr:zinc finger C2H2 type domain containing protein [Nitzschia inconspicua]
MEKFGYNNNVPDNFRNVFDSWNNTSAPCDRRLSRAARKFLHRHLLRVVLPDVGNVNDTSSVLTLLKTWISSISTPNQRTSNRTDCPLLETDIYEEDEIQTEYVYLPNLSSGLSKFMLKAAYPHHHINHQKNNGKNMADNFNYWFRCGYCGKTFVSQYYLDLHMTTQHRSSSNDIEERRICPAVKWCQLVGMANCHQQALQDEPFYDRGGSSGDSESAMIQHKWSKIAHYVTCNREVLQRDCQLILASCRFLDSKGNAKDEEDDWVPTTQLTKSAFHFCGTLSCPSQQTLWHFFEQEAHDLFLGVTTTTKRDNVPLVAASSFYAHWESAWKREADHHSSLSSSWISILFLLLLFLMLLRKVVLTAKEKWLSKKKTYPLGRRTLLKQSRCNQLKGNQTHTRSKRD